MKKIKHSTGIFQVTLPESDHDFVGVCYLCKKDVFRPENDVYHGHTIHKQCLKSLKPITIDIPGKCHYVIYKEFMKDSTFKKLLKKLPK